MIIISGAELLAYNSENKFLGESVRFAVNKNLTVRGFIYIPDEVSGVTGVFRQIKDINAFTDWDDIFLGGENFGRGKINRITYPQGDWVKLARPEISITIFDSGNPVVISGHHDLSGMYDLIHTSGFLINNLTENININYSEDGSQGLEHNITVRLNQYSGLADYSACYFAENLSNFLFNNNSNFNSTYLSGYVDSGSRTQTRTRKYDMINYDFGFIHRYNLRSDIISGTTFSYNLDFQIDEKGAGQVTENGKVRGVFPDYYANADLRYMIEALQNSYERCSGIYYFYYGSSTGILHPQHFALRSVHNVRAGTIDYSVVYVDNPNLFEDYIWDYQLSIDTNDVTNITQFAEDGTFHGNSNDPSGRYDQAVSGFLTTGDKTNASNRILSVYTGYFDPIFAADHPLTLLSSKRALKEAAGSVTYGYSWTNDITYANLTGVIRRIVSGTTTKESEDLLGIFGVNAGDGYELEQQGPNFVPGEYNQSIDVELGRLTINQALNGTGFFSDLWALVNVTGTYTSTSYEFSYPALTAKVNAVFKVYDNLVEL